MTSWQKFLFHAPPWHWKIAIVAVMPVLYWRLRRMWPFVGGWSQRFGRRVAAGVKPPHLLQLADRSIGERVFVHEEDVNARVQRNVCHELTHAFSSHLRLPAWLNEGIAMVGVDRFADKPTVRGETFDVLERQQSTLSPRDYRSMRVKDPNTMVYIYVRGYWVTRFIEETRPGLLKELLAGGRWRGDNEDRLAEAYELVDRSAFWREIDRMVVSHFRGADG
jgi:hypothetical protein